MNSRTKKILLPLLAAGLLGGAGFIQSALNRDRDTLGLTRGPVLENAPPALAFTTVALGGFRGLISNALWIRASKLQEDDKFFEMAQIADWITKLEPHFAQVWAVQGWNMAYNISVKFKDFSDRWNWVKRGIELLRDDGLRYNPDEMLLYRELAGMFNHKMGANLDDANMYYKRAWFDEMSKVFKPGETNFSALANPSTEDAKARAQLLREKYKIDPKFLEEVNERYGPLEWRLPEAHAVYWAALGLKVAKENPARVSEEDLLQLRRMIYQSMQITVVRGRVVAPSGSRKLDLAPNLGIIRKANDSYEEAMAAGPKDRDAISTGHRNFLRDAVYYLFIYGRENEAAEWFDYLAKNYPKKNLIDGRPESLPGTLSLDEYVYARIEDEFDTPGRDKTKLILEGLLEKSFYCFALGDLERAGQFDRFAKKFFSRYQGKVAGTGERVEIRSLDEIKHDVLQRFLDPARGLSPELSARLRASLIMPVQTNSAPPATAIP